MNFDRRFIVNKKGETKEESVEKGDPNKTPEITIMGLKVKPGEGVRINPTTGKPEIIPPKSKE